MQMIGMQINIDDYPGGPVLGTRWAEEVVVRLWFWSYCSRPETGAEGRRAEKKTMMELQRLAEMGRWRGVHIARMDLSKERGHM